MSGVTFMSALACGIEPVTTFSAPWCLCACCMLLASPGGLAGLAPVLRSVIRAMFSICALRMASIASMIAEYLASLSPLR